MKRTLILLFCIIFLLQLVIAQSYNLDISVISEDKIFEPGDTIKLKVNLYDSNNNLLNDQVSIVIEDVTETTITETQVQSNTIKEIDLTEDAVAGEAKIIATYKDTKVSENFFVSEKPLAKFEIQEEKLIITNIGNTIYDGTIYITIGDTTGKKSPRLNIGESVSYRLVAPDGTYNIKVREEGSESPTLEIGGVQLTGTGRVIGALDERSSGGVGITGLESEPDSEGELLGMVKNNTFVYVFVLVVFGATILIAIERRYRKKAS